MSQLREDQHFDDVRRLLREAIESPIVRAPEMFARVRARIMAAAEDGVPASRFPQSLWLPGTAVRDHGICAIEDAVARWRRDGWLT